MFVLRNVYNQGCVNKFLEGKISFVLLTDDEFRAATNLSHYSMNPTQDRNVFDSPAEHRNHSRQEMQTAAPDHTCVLGRIVQIDPEKYEGLVRIETPEKPEKLTDVRFERSSIVVDERYVSVLLAGLQVRCGLKADANDELKVVEVSAHQIL